MSARGTSKDKGLEQLDPFSRSLERKKETLDGRLQYLKSQGEDTQNNRNEMIAGVEVSEDIGIFDDKPEGWDSKPLDFSNFPGEEWTTEKERAFVIRTRRDVIHSRLNSRDILAGVEATNRRLKNIEMMVAALLVLVVVIFLWK
jgi:hypothetical protein